jgi:hypothetical protein
LSEGPVQPSNHRREHDDRDQNDDRVVTYLSPSGPRHLAELGVDLTHVLARRRAFLGRRGGGRSPWRTRRGALGGERALTAHHPLGLTVHGHGVPTRSSGLEPEPVRSGHDAGQEGFEPPTAGFGDRCSTS